MNIVPLGKRDPNRLPHPKRQEVTEALDRATPLFGDILPYLLPEIRSNRPFEDIFFEFVTNPLFQEAQERFKQSPTSMLEAMYGLRYLMWQGKIIEVSPQLDRELCRSELENRPARELQLDPGERCCYIHFGHATEQAVAVPSPKEHSLPLEGVYVVQHAFHEDTYREIHLLMVSKGQGEGDCRVGHSLEFWIRFNEPEVLVRDRLESIFRGREHFIAPVTHVFKALFAYSTAPRRTINEFDQLAASAKTQRASRLDGSYNRLVIGHE